MSPLAPRVFTLTPGPWTPFSAPTRPLPSNSSVRPTRCASSVDTVGSQTPRPVTAAPPYPGPLTVPRPPPVPWEDAILLQGFNWDSSKRNGRWYDILLATVPAIADAGVTHLWLPPPTRSVSPEGYLPTQLYDLNSKYGSRDALLALTAAALAAGVRPVADIVINHRCADEQSSDGVWNRFRDDVPHPGASIAWGPEAIACDDPDFHGRGHADSGADYGPSPDLDHENEAVKAGISDWLVWLRDYIGFEGWRLDFAKGYSAAAARYYLDASLRRPGVDFCVGEFWVDASWHGSRLDYNQDAARQGVCDWLDGVGGTAAAFDFTTKAELQEAVRRGEYDRLKDRAGKAPGLIGWWPSRAVTFVDNHDTGSSQQHWPFVVGRADLGYAYILSHPGIPCVFWDHFADGALRETIEALLAARRRTGVRADSTLQILAAEKDMYVAKIKGKGGKALVCKLGPRMDMGDLFDTAVGKKAPLVASGKDWAVWETSSGQ